MNIKAFRANWVTELIILICLCILAWIAFFQNLGSIGLVDQTEAMFVEAARQMVIRGDWVTPYWNDVTRFDKPPLSYWFMGIFMKIFGINEFAARLPSAIIALSVVFLVFYTLRRFGILHQEQLPSNSWIWAGIGAVMLIFNPIWIAWARTAVSDMFLAGSISFCLLSFFWGYAQPIQSQWRWYVSFYIFLALGILSKGPVAIVLPGIIIVSFLIYVGQWRKTLKQMRLKWGFLIVSVIAIPWFVAVTTANGWDYINTFFGYHNIERYTSVVNRHAGPWYYYFPVLIISLAPWSSYLPLSLYRLKFWQRRYWMGQTRESQLGLFAFFWLAMIFGFFTISATKLPSYILPAIPAAVIIMALLWKDAWTEKSLGSDHKWAFIFSTLFYLIFLSALSVASLFVPQFVDNNPLTPELSQNVQASGLALNSCIVWGIASVVSLFLIFFPRLWRWLWVSGMIGFCCFILFFTLPLMEIFDVHSQLPLRKISQTIVSIRQPQENLLMVGFKRPSVVFYAQTPVKFFYGAEDYLKDLETRKQEKEKFYLIAETKRIKNLELDQEYVKSVQKNRTYQLFELDLRNF